MNSSAAINLHDCIIYPFNNAGCRGNLDKAIELFGKALRLARTEIEMVVLYKMHEAASAQKSLATKTGILAPNLAGAGMM